MIVTTFGAHITNGASLCARIVLVGEPASGGIHAAVYKLQGQTAYHPMPAESTIARRGYPTRQAAKLADVPTSEG